MTRAGEVPFLNRFFAEQSNLTTRPMAIVSSTKPPRTA